MVRSRRHLSPHFPNARRASGDQAEESRWVVYAALIGNSLVAAAKFAAAAVSGSSAMLTEAVHSSADCTNQLLLLLGDRRSKKAPDASHPFGYDGEMYFWAFVVAVMVLLAGGSGSIYQGVQQLQHPHAINSPILSLTVLVFSALFEGGSLFVGYRASLRIIARHPGDGRPVSMWKFIELSKDPKMYESLLEDAAALIGIGLAAIGVMGSAFLGLLWMDAAASIAIGVLLVANSYVIAHATRSLIAGEAIAPQLKIEIEQALSHAGFEDAYVELKSLHLGPATILVMLSVRRADEFSGTSFSEHLDQISGTIKHVDQRIQHVFFTLA